MWLFRAPAQNGPKQEPEDTDDPEEVQLKLEARQAADSRDRLRCNVTTQLFHVGGDEAASNFDQADVEGPELDDMYDFARFHPERAPLAKVYDITKSSSESQERRQVEAFLRALVRLQAIAAESLVLAKDFPDHPEAQVRLRQLLREQHQLLREVETPNSINISSPATLSPETSKPIPLVDSAHTLPPTPPLPQVPAPVVDEEQIFELTRIAEELTDALEASRVAEDEALLALQEERNRCASIASAAEAQATECAALRETLARQEEAAAADRSRLRELELRVARAELEQTLEKALSRKGRSLKFRHVDI